VGLECEFYLSALATSFYSPNPNISLHLYFIKRYSGSYMGILMVWVIVIDLVNVGYVDGFLDIPTAGDWRFITL
jgi:fibronectin type 3 domain-containing protein